MALVAPPRPGTNGRPYRNQPVREVGGKHQSLVGWIDAVLQRRQGLGQPPGHMFVAADVEGQRCGSADVRYRMDEEAANDIVDIRAGSDDPLDRLRILGREPRATGARGAGA